MMAKNINQRILAIAPTSRGTGFAVLEESLVDWGVRTVKGVDKNARCVAGVAEMIALYQPSILVLEDYSGKDSRRALRIRKLGQQIVALAKTRQLKVKLFTREHVRQVFFADGQGTKHELAEILARWFPEELANRLPPKRRAWMSEDSRMGTFEAVALAVTAAGRTALPTIPDRAILD